MLTRLFKGLFTSQAQRDQQELELAQTLVHGSDLDSASTVLDTLLARSTDDASALLLRGVVRRLLNRPREAIEDLEHAQALEADTGTCLFQLALCWQMLGDTAQALEHCKRAREVAPEFLPAFFLLTQLSLPGDNYADVLARIIGHLKPKTYVEIGVFQGSTLKLAKSAKVIVGVDPNPQIDWPLEPHMRVFKTTSDAFFAAHELTAELGNRAVDVAFIDGMHQFEFAMRDFANVERNCRPDSVVLIHDCYPLDEESAGREPRASCWSGDVWRLIVLLKKYRPDLVIHTIAAAPTGLAVIQNLNPKSTYLLDNQAALYAEFLALDYSFLDDNKADKLNLFPNRWSEIVKMIRPRAQR